MSAITFEIPGRPVPKGRPRHSDKYPCWTEEEIQFLRDHYPERGKMWCAEQLGRGEGATRGKASELGLHLSHSSPFWEEFQSRAAASKVGKKRPDQALVIRRLHDEGKLKKTPEARIAVGVRTKAWIAEHGHPRGALGMQHTAETKAKIAAKAKARWADMDDEMRDAYSKRASLLGMRTVQNREKASWKAGWREIGGKRKYFRSRWEANYARYLQWLKERGAILEWEHEPETFWFEGIKRGCMSYLPDFRVTEKNGSVAYHEVKGWMDDRSKTTIKRMAKYHPEVTLIVIDAGQYRALAKQIAPLLDGWE